jgi:hypothetical protein
MAKLTARNRKVLARVKRVVEDPTDASVTTYEQVLCSDGTVLQKWRILRHDRWAHVWPWTVKAKIKVGLDPASACPAWVAAKQKAGWIAV